MTVPREQRQPNNTLKAMRLAVRMSQNELAAAVRQAGRVMGEPNGCTKRLVQKWESGEHADVRPNYKRALTAALRTPFEQLGFATTPAPTLPVIITAPARHITTTHADAPDATGRAAERLWLALERPAHADGNAVDMAGADVARLFADEQHRPAGPLLHVTARHVHYVAGLLAGARSTQRRRLTSMAGASAALAGWLAWQTGQDSTAHRFWDVALAAASHAGDPPLHSCVLLYRSHAAAESGDAATGWRLAHTAAAHAGQDARSQAWIAARTAQDAAHLGEHEAALTNLKQALTLGGDLAATTPRYNAAPWASFVDGACLHAMAAHVHRQLGQPSTALHHAEQAHQRLSEAPTKTRALILAEIACAHAQAAQLTAMEHTALQAADLTEKLHATHARHRLRALHGLLQPHRDTASAQRVNNRITALLDE